MKRHWTSDWTYVVSGEQPALTVSDFDLRIPEKLFGFLANPGYLLIFLLIVSLLSKE